MASGFSDLFRQDGDEPVENDKLLDLYWNRAGLKKEFASLRAEKFKLQDRIKEQEGATLRVQQKMDHLESLLLDREWAHTVLVYYQLRRLHAHCHKRLARFAEELKQHRERRVQQTAIEKWQQSRKAEVSSVEKQLGVIRLKAQKTEDALQEAQQRQVASSGMSRLIKGKPNTADIEKLERALGETQKQEQRLLARLEALNTENEPDHAGLSIGRKRSINFLIIALAQQLFLHLESADLATLVKEAGEKSVGAINYGKQAECDEILVRADRMRKRLEASRDAPDALRKRARQISAAAIFKSEEDAVPLAVSVTALPGATATATGGATEVNLLGGNYFAITKVLSR